MRTAVWLPEMIRLMQVAVYNCAVSNGLTRLIRIPNTLLSPYLPAFINN
jgi:hypothetical protein